MSGAQIFTFIIGSIVVISGAYFVTFLVARGSQRVYRGRLIQVLDRFSLAKDKSLMLIAVYDQIYLVAFAAGSVTLLDNIAPETAAAFATSSPQPQDGLRQAGNMAALLLSRLRRRPPQQGADMTFPYEDYLPEEAAGENKPESFAALLQSRLGKAPRREEDNRS